MSSSLLPGGGRESPHAPLFLLLYVLLPDPSRLATAHTGCGALRRMSSLAEYLAPSPGYTSMHHFADCTSSCLIPLGWQEPAHAQPTGGGDAGAVHHGGSAAHPGAGKCTWSDQHDEAQGLFMALFCTPKHWIMDRQMDECSSEWSSAGEVHHGGSDAHPGAGGCTAHSAIVAYKGSFWSYLVPTGMGSWIRRRVRSMCMLK